MKKGVCEGFDIIDPGEYIHAYDSANYRSVMSGPAYEFIDTIIQREIKSGKYMLQETKPTCVHLLGAVPKSNGKYWPITDCKQPLGYSINNFMCYTHQPFVYKTVDDVTDMLFPGAFTATVDISAAYRTIPINPKHREYQGIRWKVGGKLRYLVDTHMCFGLKYAPFIFTQISNFIVRCMQRRGYYRVVNYIDDFICAGSTYGECQHVQKVLINLLIRLGFAVAWDKCVGPSQRTKYLGVFFDTKTMQLVLPEEKIMKLHKDLEFFAHKTRATCRQIQKLCGTLSHCAKIVRGGRTFSHRIIEFLRGATPKKRIRLNNDFKEDFQWWIHYSKVFNGSATMIMYNFGQGPWLSTDASSTGYGIYSNSDWMAGQFSDEVPSSNIDLRLDDRHGHWLNVIPPLLHEKDNNVNFWEMIPVWLAIKRWSRIWTNMHVVVFSDNQQVVYAINKGFSNNKSSMSLIREIFWDCACGNLYLTARYLRGEHNVIADMLSRLADPLFVNKFMHYSLCCRLSLDSGMRS